MSREAEIRALAMLTDQVNQLSGDNRVLSEALRDIEDIAAEFSIDGRGAILHLVRLPAVKAAMNL